METREQWLKWRSEGIAKEAFHLYSTHGLPFEDYIEVLDNTLENMDPVTRATTLAQLAILGKEDKYKSLADVPGVKI